MALENVFFRTDEKVKIKETGEYVMIHLVYDVENPLGIIRKDEVTYDCLHNDGTITNHRQSELQKVEE
jgi:hypothetical protein